MSGPSLVRTSLRGGVWEGVLSGAAGAPALEVTHLDREIADVALAPLGEDRWSVRIILPAEVLTEGLQTVLICDRATGARLDRITLLCGAPVDDDIRAEVDLLRAEIEMLKRAFRRHVAEGGH